MRFVGAGPATRSSGSGWPASAITVRICSIRLAVIARWGAYGSCIGSPPPQDQTTKFADSVNRQSRSPAPGANAQSSGWGWPGAAGPTRGPTGIGDQ
jgi:hypothetical protein